MLGEREAVAAFDFMQDALGHDEPLLLDQYSRHHISPQESGPATALRPTEAGTRRRRSFGRSTNRPSAPPPYLDAAAGAVREERPNRSGSRFQPRLRGSDILRHQPVPRRLPLALDAGPCILQHPGKFL